MRAAGDLGYDPESYEKVHVLVNLLESVRAHPFLGSRMALKGGTAINLFVLDLPRLSVDVDLNYVGAADRETMLAERPLVEESLRQVAGRLGLNVKRIPTEHAGGKWRLAYSTALNRPGHLEIDINFMLRTPLWAPEEKSSPAVGGATARTLILDPHELVAGKLAALVARSASRDFFDAREILRRLTLDPARLRLGFIVYGGINRRDWRTVTVDDIGTTADDVDTQLSPMLRRDVRPARGQLAAWTETMNAETRELMGAVLPFTAPEREFLERLNGSGDIVPELLTTDPAMQTIIGRHPGLAWKALNVKKQS